MWTGTVLLPPGRSLEAKLVVVDGSPSGRWEPGGNRSFMVPIAPPSPPSGGKAASSTEAQPSGDTLTDPVKVFDLQSEIEVAEDGQAEVLQYDGDSHHHHGGFSHGWLDPGSCVDPQEEEEDEEAIPLETDPEEDTASVIGQSYAAQSSAEARSPEVALVFHWGLSTFSQVGRGESTGNPHLSGHADSI